MRTYLRKKVGARIRSNNHFIILGIFALAVLSLPILMGCAPWCYELTPAISGFVLDADSQQGVPNAIVKVVNRENSLVVASTLTNNLGRFDLLSSKGWGIYCVLQEPYVPLGYDIEVIAKGYRPLKEPLCDQSRFEYDNEQWRNKIFLLKSTR